jgi:hypothetical protein
MSIRFFVYLLSVPGVMADTYKKETAISKHNKGRNNKK